jgi:hypothetical protein
MNEAKAEAEWYYWFAKMFLVLALEHLGFGPFEDQSFKIGNSLYEIATQKLSRAEFKKMNRWLDTLLPAALENAL